MSPKRAAGSAVRKARQAWPAIERAPCLLDFNVLIALIDPLHTQHERAHRFLRRTTRWATCPLTENAVLRIVGHPCYPNSPGSPAPVATIVAGLREHPRPQFWPDEISLLDPARVEVSRLPEAGQVTDSYLLALAVARGGRLATFDRHLVTDAVEGGRAALHLID